MKCTKCGYVCIPLGDKYGSGVWACERCENEDPVKPEDKELFRQAMGMQSCVYNQLATEELKDNNIDADAKEDEDLDN